jgi:ABC-type thiamine transport system ATPase subunit
MDQYELSIDKVSERISGSIDCDKNEWNVGVIYGASGTGKSTIAQNLFEGSYIRQYDYGLGSVLDEMPRERAIDEIAAAFNSVGFATVWSWLKPYGVLSTGEKMRVDLARALLEDRDVIVFGLFFKNQIVKNYPESNYAKYLINPNYFIEEEARKDSLNTLYTMPTAGKTSVTC